MILNRIAENGSCITVKKDIGDFREDFERPSFELEFTKITMDPLDECYVEDQTFGGSRGSIAGEFMTALVEMKSALLDAIETAQVSTP